MTPVKVVVGIYLVLLLSTHSYCIVDPEAKSPYKVFHESDCAKHYTDKANCIALPKCKWLHHYGGLVWTESGATKEDNEPRNGKSQQAAIKMYDQLVRDYGETKIDYTQIKSIEQLLGHINLLKVSLINLDNEPGYEWRKYDVDHKWIKYAKRQHDKYINTAPLKHKSDIEILTSQRGTTNGNQYSAPKLIQTQVPLTKQTKVELDKSADLRKVYSGKFNFDLDPKSKHDHAGIGAIFQFSIPEGQDSKLWHGFASGALISDRHVLTVQHNFWELYEFKFEDIHSMKFFPNYRRGRGLKKGSLKKPAIPGDGCPDGNTFDKPFTKNDGGPGVSWSKIKAVWFITSAFLDEGLEDIAIMELETPIKNPHIIGISPVQPKSVNEKKKTPTQPYIYPETTNFYTSGYPMDYYCNKLTTYPTCSAFRFSDNANHMEFDDIVVGGQSGSPIIHKDYHLIFGVIKEKGDINKGHLYKSAGVEIDFAKFLAFGMILREYTETFFNFPPLYDAEDVQQYIDIEQQQQKLHLNKQIRKKEERMKNAPEGLWKPAEEQCTIPEYKKAAKAPSKWPTVPQWTRCDDQYFSGDFPCFIVVPNQKLRVGVDAEGIEACKVAHSYHPLLSAGRKCFLKPKKKSIFATHTIVFCAPAHYDSAHGQYIDSILYYEDIEPNMDADYGFIHDDRIDNDENNFIIYEYLLLSVSLASSVLMIGMLCCCLYIVSILACDFGLRQHLK